MKKIILLISVCLFSSFSFAQKITYSKSIKLNNKTPRFKVLGRNANFFIAERWGTKYHFIDLYNADLKKISSKELRFEKENKLKKIWIQPNKGWVIYTNANKDFTLLEAKKLDAKFNIKTKPLLLDSIVERRDLVADNLRITSSLNEKYLAVYLPIFSKGKLDYFYIKVYDTNLKVVHEMKLRDAYVKDGSFVDIEISNKGEAIAIFKDKNKTNDFKIYFINSTNEIKSYPLTLSFPVFKRLKFSLDNINNNLLVAGFKLSDETKKKPASDAFFTLKMNLETGQISKNTLEVFEQEFFKLLTGRESKSDKVTLQTFYIKEIIPKIDGGYLVFAESYYENEEIVEIPQNQLNNGSAVGAAVFIPSTSTYKTNYFHYNDVIVYTINAEQEIEAVNIIKKRQRSEDDNGGYSSFKIVNQQNLLELLFLDEININSSLKKYTINGSSELFKDYILNVNQNNVMPVIKMAVQTAPNEVLIPSYLNNNFSLIKVTFEDN